jgi:hypothetical protein
MPLPQSHMKRTTIKKTLGVTIVAVALATLVFWGRISEAFGPMKQHELQCLICHRERVEKWVCGSKVRDDIVTNKYSDWIDSFTSSNHQHVWIGHTSYNRHYWFGRTSIGCGGIAAIPRIFEQRNNLGESESQQLAAKFHQLVRGQSPQIDFNELDRFTKAVVDDPASLLKPDNSN